MPWEPKGKGAGGADWVHTEGCVLLAPRTNLDRWGRLRMGTSWATAGRAAALLLLLLQCFELVESTGHAGNRGCVRPPIG